MPCPVPCDSILFFVPRTFFGPKFGVSLILRIATSQSNLLRGKIASLGKYKHLKGKSKYLKGENHQKVKKVRKLQAKKTHKNKKFLRLDFEHC